jgi:hypothetical protein
VVSSILDPKAFCGCIASILLLGVGVGFLFRGIVEKLTGYPPKGIGKDLNIR